ncbi:MAG: GNAT family N-acetyltransferase [Acidobacteria bacterium]|nr:GNAT family N-acetyltransferase [Acidobacteriota bacterium]MBI3657786.1 GNAT family N-acetyltransferase [Acidobacteriota bacterium]
MEFHPLIEVDPSLLTDLLAEERRDWIEELSWDPGEVQQLILRYVGQRLLPGFAAFEEGRAVGYTYYLTRDLVGILGTLYLVRTHRRHQAVVDLLTTTLDCLRRFSRIDRLEAQIFPFGIDLIPAFAHFGFKYYRRHYLRKFLSDFPAANSPGVLHKQQSFRLMPWTEELVDGAAIVIQSGYAGSIDREICSEYASYTSCLVFLRNLVSNPGCGKFLPQASFMILDENELLSGVILVSQLSAATALIAQISVLPGYQGLGLGSLLMDRAFTALKELGYSQVCLSVSEQNQRAYTWYQQIGFQRYQELMAFVWHGQAA